jgi:glycosyltransferase involved in cell wall biosynthesis
VISIVIPARNAQLTLEVLLDSIRDSSFKNTEAIVVDDASTDNTAEIAKGFGARVVQLDKQSGPAAARNLGADVAQGEILLFLDSDVRLHQDTLGYIASRFNREPDLNCLVGIYSKLPLNKGFFPRYKALLCYFWFENAKAMESFETSCGAIRRKVFIEMGGFSTQYRGAAVEDYELGYRLGKKYKIVLDTNVQVDHHFPGFLQNAKKFFQRGRLWFRLFLKRKRFDSAGSTFSEALGTMAALPVLIAVVYAALRGANGSYVLIVCCTAYILINMRFFIYCLKEQGPGFCSAAIPTHLVNSIVVLSGIITALLPLEKRP